MLLHKKVENLLPQNRLVVQQLHVIHCKVMKQIWNHKPHVGSVETNLSVNALFEIKYLQALGLKILINHDLWYEDIKMTSED